jgi:hypothetical protein
MTCKFSWPCQVVDKQTKTDWVFMVMAAVAAAAVVV